MLTNTPSLQSLSIEDNQWQNVQDFNWLSSTSPSPNWSILPEEQRTHETYPALST